MILGQVFNPKAIKINLESEDKDEVFEELVEEIINIQPDCDREVALAAIKEREALMSTGIMHEIAVPHGKTDAVKGVVGAIGISRKGIEYDSLDKAPVKIIFLFLSAKSECEYHLQALKKLAQILEDSNFVKELLVQETPQGVYDVVCKYEQMFLI